MNPTTRAKFVCISTTSSKGYVTDETGHGSPGTLTSYKFQCVGGGSEENKRFFASTPAGTLELTAVRDGLFELGKEYYLDFTPTVVPA